MNRIATLSLSPTCRKAVLSMLLLMSVPACAVDNVPAPPKPSYPLINALDYKSSRKARQDWSAGHGTSNVSSEPATGRNVLRLPCHFRGRSTMRAVWDFPVNLDLSEARGIRFHFMCTNTLPISHFTFYLKSGSGWYAAPFRPGSASGWSTITISKENMTTEDKPSGWSRINRIRVAVWRGSDGRTDCYMANLGRLGEGADLVMVRGDSMGEKQTVARYSRTIGGQLDRLAIPYTVISDLDLSRETLKGRKLVILPYNASLPNKAATALKGFMDAGGKLVCFYVLPESLEQKAGIRRGIYLQPSYPGQFSSIRPVYGSQMGLPAATRQTSWNIQYAQPIAGHSVTEAYWFDLAGKSTHKPAIISSSNTILMTHVFIDDDPANKRLLLLAMVARFWPECWQKAAEESIANIGRFSYFQDTESAFRELRRLTKDVPAAGDLVKEAIRMESEALRQKSLKHYPAARSFAGMANKKLIEAYCRVQRSEPGEFRGVWCHRAMGVNGMSWDEAIRRLADNGFTAIFPNMLWAGTAYYKSRILPMAPEVAVRGDQLKACLDACHKYGIECHVWKIFGNMGDKAPASFVKKMRLAGRVQVSRAGKASGKWLCPSHPENQKLAVDSLVEVARNYDIDGIHLDYIRYPGSQYCFCDGCRARFEKKLGRRVKNWPEDTDESLSEEWQAFRQASITKVVADVSAAVRAVNPKVKISAAVFPNLTTDRYLIAQDWELWCAKGYLDFVCPMDYDPATASLDTLVQRQKQWVGNVPCYPGIGLSTWPEPADICRLIDQISVTRKRGMGGFVIFEYRDAEARDVFPLCKLGITRRH